MQTKTLRILLTRYPTRLSKLLCFLNRCNYLHASLGLDENPDVYYSFGVNGFRTEIITHSLKPNREPYPCALYELEVSPHTYENVQKIIRDFEQRRTLLHYTYQGAAFALLRLGMRRENHYFCSQFVAHILAKAHAITLKKDSCLYLAEDLTSLEGVHQIYCGNLLDFALKYGLLIRAA